MRIFRKLIVFLISLVVLLTIIGLFLPQQVHIERAVSISKNPETVYPYVDNPKTFNQWSPWARMDPKTIYSYSGPERGVGAAMSWDSEDPNVGKGSWTITEAIPNKLVNMALDFGEMGTATSFFKFEPEDQGTRVIWGFDEDLGMNPIARWFGLMLEKWVGAEYEKGLINLKELVEEG